LFDDVIRNGFKPTISSPLAAEFIMPYKHQNNPQPELDSSALSVSFRLSGTMIAFFLGAAISLIAGLSAENTQVQTQRQNQTQVTNCSIGQPNTVNPNMPASCKD